MTAPLMTTSPPTAFDLRDIPLLDETSAAPLYAQVAERIAEKIKGVQAELAGRQIPTENECAAYFKVSRPTIRQAMQTLINQGLIVRGRGIGTFVAPPKVHQDLGRTFESELRPGNRNATFTLLKRSLVAPSARVRAILGLGPEDKVEHMLRLRSLDGEVFGFEERFIAAEMAARLAPELLATATGSRLAQHMLGAEPARIAFTVRAKEAPPHVAAHLGIREGAPVLASEHTYFRADGRAFIYGTVFFNADRYEFSFQAAVKAD